MSTPLESQRARFVADVVRGVRLWRQHGAQIRRSRALCQCADSLRLRRERDWEKRSARLYRRVIRELSAWANRDLASDTDVGSQAHQALESATKPFRVARIGMAKIAGGVALLSAVVFLLAIAVSPSLRARCFPTDLAAGRPWTVPNSQDGYPSSGNGPSSAGNTLFHTTSLDSPSVEIQLDGEHVIRKIVVVNRADCCQERALPLNVEILGSAGWKLIAQRRAAFSTWEYDVEPVRASVIRVRRPGSGYFHLKRISVYGQ